MPSLSFSTAQKLFPSVEIFYFCDGACSKNPGPGGWGFLAFDARKDLLTERGGASSGETTNNRMELQAILEVLQHFTEQPYHSAKVFLDSEYVRKGLHEWLPNWKKRNWIKADGKAVLNRDLWESLDELFPSLKDKVHLQWVPGHEGVVGNERVDEIAVAFSRGESMKLLEGSAEAFTADVFGGLPTEAAVKKKKSSAPVGAPQSKTPLKAPVYLSVIGGVLERHFTWAECELRVKGKSGARFKKVSTQEEESKFVEEYSKAK